jgi:hypothetical protein
MILRPNDIGAHLYALVADENGRAAISFTSAWAFLQNEHRGMG